MDPLEILKDSKCFTCKHRLSRIFEPATQEDREYYMDLLGIDIEEAETYELHIEQHKCLLTEEDIDGIIRECNMYEGVFTNQLIREYKF